MKVKTLLISICSISFFYGCATTPEIKKVVTVATPFLVATPAKNQKIGFEDTITSKKKNFVSLAPYTKLDFSNKTMFMLSIQNLGEEPIDISCDNISVIFENDNKDGSAYPISVQSLGDVMNDFKNASRANELRILKGVVGPYVCTNFAGRSVLTEEEKWGFDITPNYDEVDLHQGRMVLERMHEQNQQILEAMPDFILSRQIIMPSESYSGVVVCDTRQADSAMEGIFKISVSVEDDEHTFAFNRSFTGGEQGEYEAPVYHLNFPEEIKHRLAGEWNGILTLKTFQQTVPMAYVFRFENSENGDFRGFLYMPEEGGLEFPITDANISDKKLVLKVEAMGGEYSGKISGDKIAGDWIQTGAGSTPLTLNKGKYVPPEYTLNLPEETMDQLAGNWNGKIDDIEVTFRFEKDEGGDFKGFYIVPQMEQLEQMSLPIMDATIIEGKLTLKVKTQIPSEFIGIISDGRLVGDWKDMEKRTLLILDKEMP